MKKQVQNKHDLFHFSREVLCLDLEVAKGIAIDEKSGERIICDHKHGCLLVLDRDGVLIGKLGENMFQVPTHVVIHPMTGHLIITDRRARTIQVMNRKTQKIVQKFELDVNLEQSIPHGVAVDPVSGNVIVSDRGEHTIHIYDYKSGKIKKTFGSLGQDEGKFCDPRGVAVDNHGQILVCDTMNHRLQLFDGDGQFLRCIGTEGSGPGQFSLPSAACIDHQGNYVVIDCGNRRIQVLSPDENHECLYLNHANEIQLPSGIALDKRDGSIVVSDLHSVLVFERRKSTKA